MYKINIPKIFDTHAHFREGDMMAGVIPCLAPYLRYAVAMGNLKEPILGEFKVKKYYAEIKKIALFHGYEEFEPIITVMLTYGMTPKILEESFYAGARILKLIPGGSSTNSDQGVALWDLPKFYPVLEKVQKLGMIFSVHCELPVKPGKAEKIPLLHQEEEGIPYIDKVIKAYPRLKIVFEHISSLELCQYFLELDSLNIGATLTGHHAFINYDQVIHSGSDEKVKNTWLYCKPIAKFSDDIREIKKLIISGHPRVFYGSDFAPHPPENKINGAAGIANIPEVAISMLWELFINNLMQEEALERFVKFTSKNALSFYNMPEYKNSLVLAQEKWIVPEKLENDVHIFKGGDTLNWKIKI